MTEGVITIPSRITKGEELIVIPRSLYEKFFEKNKRERRKIKKTPVETEEEIVDKIIALGDKEVKENKTITNTKNHY